LVHPIVFLYRHYLELRLKSLVPITNRLLDSETKYKPDHDLLKVWAVVRPNLEQIWPDSGDELKIVDDGLRQFAAVDPDSYAFRYPADKNRVTYKRGGVEVINLRNLRDEVAKIALILDGSQDGALEYQEIKNDMADYYRP
jgi:hypothetical protein